MGKYDLMTFIFISLILQHFSGKFTFGQVLSRLCFPPQQNCTCTPICWCNAGLGYLSVSSDQPHLDPFAFYLLHCRRYFSENGGIHHPLGSWQSLHSKTHTDLSHCWSQCLQRLWPVLPFSSVTTALSDNIIKDVSLSNKKCWKYSSGIPRRHGILWNNKKLWYSDAFENFKWVLIHLGNLDMMWGGVIFMMRASTLPTSLVIFRSFCHLCGWIMN